MTRFWNLQTKFVVVLVILLLGSLATQMYFHERSKERLFEEVLTITEDVANEATSKVPQVVYVSPDPAPVTKFRLFAFSRRQHEPEWKRERVSSTRTEGRVRERLRNERNTEERLRLLVKQVKEEIAAAQNAVAAELRSRDSAGRDSELRHRDYEDLEGQVLFPSFTHPEGEPSEHSHILPGDSFVLQIQPGGLTSQRGRRGDSGSRLPIMTEEAFARLSSASSPGSETIDLTQHTERVELIFEDYRRKDLLATLGVFLLGIGLAWFVGVRMTRPVNTLVTGFQRVADGDLDTRVPERQSGEFARLGTQFNAMVGRIRENQELQRELELRERVQHMGDLAAGVAHDVRNPLNAIHLNVGHIRDQFVPSDEGQRERFLRFTSDVQREVERLNQLVTNFLSLAQPSSGDLEPLAPNELVRDLVRLLRKEAVTRHVELGVALADNMPALPGNAQELKSAFLNVAMNALQAMESAGGGKLDVVTGLREDDTDGDEIAISFVDSGVGISEENLKRIFIPYFTTRDGGTGLGMAIAQRIAERYHGRVEVRSRVGEGTTVSFIFPVQPPTLLIGSPSGSNSDGPNGEVC